MNEVTKKRIHLQLNCSVSMQSCQLCTFSPRQLFTYCTMEMLHIVGANTYADFAMNLNCYPTVQLNVIIAPDLFAIMCLKKSQECIGN